MYIEEMEGEKGREDRRKKKVLLFWGPFLNVMCSLRLHFFAGRRLKGGRKSVY